MCTDPSLLSLYAVTHPFSPYYDKNDDNDDDDDDDYDDISVMMPMIMMMIITLAMMAITMIMVMIMTMTIPLFFSSRFNGLIRTTTRIFSNPSRSVSL